MFLGGFMSDMTGTKATAIADHCRSIGRACLLFDYTGHGASSGRFEDGTIGRWAADATAALDRLTTGPQIMVGSSMGGWIMLRVALARPARVAALVGIAAAPDFTDDFVARELSAEAQAALATDGRAALHSPYGETPHVITRRLIEDGREQRVLCAPIPLSCPVRLLHGMQDDSVPWQRSLRLAEALSGVDVVLTLIKDGDHRLSRDSDIGRLLATIDSLASDQPPAASRAASPSR
ncbi:MAG: alpha/beta hydrolase [Alphaproteobacteria bacterium]|nr:alpha/beta hydrolase [Alphaproteobacteria bacterium]